MVCTWLRECCGAFRDHDASEGSTRNLLSSVQSGQEQVKELARESRFCDHYAARLLPLAWLAPDLAAAVLEGRQPRALSLVYAAEQK